MRSYTDAGYDRAVLLRGETGPRPAAPPSDGLAAAKGGYQLRNHPLRHILDHTCERNGVLP